MTTYTPAQLEAWAGLGPWCQPDGPEYGVMLDRVPSRPIHGFLGQPIFDKQPHDDWFEQEMANAALIAAAPDLARLVLEKDAEIARKDAALKEMIATAEKMLNAIDDYNEGHGAWLSDPAIFNLARAAHKARQAMKETSDE